MDETKSAVRESNYESFKFEKGGMMQILWQDLRFGLRLLAKHPGFTLIAIITLAFGIGANTAIFSVVNAVLLRPLRYQEPERLVRLWASSPERGLAYYAVSAPDFLDWQQQNRVLERMAAYDPGENYNLTGGQEPEQLPGIRVSADLFPLLGVDPMLGRAFSREEDAPGSNAHVVILSYNLWQRRFAAEPKLIGQTITLGGESHTVIGVMPPGFQLPSNRSELWLPLALDPNVTGRGMGFLRVLARMKPGVTFEQVQREMAAIAERLAHEYPAMNTQWGVIIKTLTDVVVSQQIRQALLVLLAAVGLVLLIACANITNLLLVYATGRQREIAIRAAFGASRWCVMRQLLTESVLLALIGGLTGSVLALWIVDLVVSSGASSIPRTQEIGIDGTVLGFTFAVSLLAGVISGILPAWQSSKSDITKALKEGGAAAIIGRHRLRSTLIVAEIALSLVLLIGAGLMIKSFLQLQRLNPGFNPQNVVTLPVTLPAKKYSQPPQVRNFFQELTARLEALPGVHAVGAINVIPLGGGNPMFSFAIEGKPPGNQQDAPSASYRLVMPGYFRAMEIPLLKGRAFTSQDDDQGEPVVIISDTLARRYWPGEDPLGKRIRAGAIDGGPWYTIIGVAGDVKFLSLDSDQGTMFYLPYLQFPQGPLVMVARTATDPIALIAAMQNQVWVIDKDQPVAGVKTMEEVLAQSFAPSRFFMFLMGSFATVALLLALVGVYSVISYVVTQRTREIGIRVALGAQPRNIFRLIVGHGMKPVLLGVALGIVASFFLTSVMEKLLYQVSVTDRATFVVISLMVTIVALLATFLPTRRAIKVDPISALRDE